MERMRRIILAAGMVMALASPGHATCAGDCSGNGEVTVEELLSGVEIALGYGSVGQCGALDVGDYGRISIDELIGAVNGHLTQCSGVPAGTSTPTATPSRPVSTQTATPSHAVSTPTPTPTATPSPSGPTPTSVASCGDGTFSVVFSDVSPDSNVTPDALDLPRGVAHDVGPSTSATYVWAISGEPCSQGFGEVKRSFSINVSDSPGPIVPGTYAVSFLSPPFIRVDYRETRFVLGNPSQNFAHQWLSTGGTLEIADAGGGSVHVHATGVTMNVGQTFPGAVGTFTMEISGTVKLTHN